MWAFVGKKQKNCDPTNPADDHQGDWWDHLAYDPEHKPVLAVVPGARVTENAEEVATEVKGRLDRPPRLMTSDDHAAYETAIRTTFSQPGEAEGPGRRPPAAAGASDRGGPGVRDGAQGAREGARGVGPQGRRGGHPGGGGPGVAGVGVQPDDQHVVRGASPWDGPGPERAEGASDVSLQQGLGGP
jgi:hypothetical protein